jgi:hypothetical protein
MDLPKDLQGLPWFTEVEWLVAKAGMADGPAFDDSYAGFVEGFERIEHALRRKGYATLRIHIRMAEFASWCRASGRQVDAGGRAAFAAWKAKDRPVSRRVH